MMEATWRGPWMVDIGFQSCFGQSRRLPAAALLIGRPDTRARLRRRQTTAIT